MKNYKEDGVISGPGGFRVQTFVNYKNAYWDKCESLNCELLSKCQKNFAKNKAIDCVFKFPKVRLTESEAVLENKYSYHNATGNTWLSRFLDIIDGTNTSADITIDKAIFTSWKNRPNEDTTLLVGSGSNDDNHQVGSDITPSFSQSGNTLTITTNLGSVDCNGLNTTVSASSATTSFTLTSVSGLATGGGDRLEIQLADDSFVRRDTAGISGSTVTITEALPAIPAAGRVVRQINNNVYLATSDDVMISGLPYGKFKSNSVTSVITHTMRLKGN